MSTIILIVIVIVIAIGALLFLRSRKDQTDSGNKTKTNKTNTKAAEAAPAAREQPAEPKIELNNLLTQLTLLINDKEFSKAEASINRHLKQDSSLHDLYLKLADIYHAQEDDFAIKKLLDTLQKANLNEVYQRVYNEHETFKANQAKAQALAATQKAPDYYEYTPSSTSAPTTSLDNTSSFDSLASEDTASSNHLEFANLAMDIPTKTEDNTLSFDSLTTQEPAPATDSPSLDFNLASPTPTPVQESPTLDFNLSTPVAEAPVAEPSLDFKFDAPSATPEPATETQDFNFNIEQPAVETSAPAANLDFSLETSAPTTSNDSLSFNLAPEPEVAPAETTETTSYADINDPIVQSFAELSVTDPVELDIELAEQYIRLGANDAAKALLQAHSSLSSDQSAKVEILLQKIA